MFFRNSNPAIRRLVNYTNAEGDTATYGGIALKSFYFVLITFVAAAASFILIAEGVAFTSNAYLIILIAAPFLALICSLIASFVPRAVPVAGTLYSLLQGIFIGFVSFIYEAYANVVFAALISTVSVLLVMSVLYFTGVIRVGSFFRKFMLSKITKTSRSFYDERLLTSLRRI